MRSDREDDVRCIRHEPCPSCGSRDNLGRYADGHGYCFGCGYYQHGDKKPVKESRVTPSNLIRDLRFIELKKRGIRKKTAQKWGYGISTINGKQVQVANYCDQSGRLVAQKVRFPGKKFSILGNSKEMGLWGQHLWRDGGKMVVVTEGEIDALSVSQLQDDKWPVTSIPKGSKGAARAIKESIEWLEKFEKVVLMFDMDAPGRRASVECAQLLTPGKARIASLPCKDANDCLQVGKGREVIQAIWDAKVYRPDGIVDGCDLWGSIISTETVPSVPYPWDGLQQKTLGMRSGEIVTICAGSGVGKSSIARHLGHWLLHRGERVGYIALEESVRRTALGILGIEMRRPLHFSLAGVPKSKLKKAYEATVGSGRLFLYDHFGSLESGNLMNRIRYMARGCEAGWIFLDHLSIVVSGLDESAGDERRLIDNTMTNLRSLVEELKVGLVLVSHLKRPPGPKGHEEGAKTSLGQLRGSAAIGQLSDICIGAERNQQSDKSSHVTKLRILKNRFTGETGLCGALLWDKKHSVFKEADADFPAVDDEADEEEGEDE